MTTASGPEQAPPAPAFAPEEALSPAPARFSTFQGVFRPIVLTVLGALLYLREGWLVGNNGLLGAIAVILACYAITGATALSLSSIATNVRVRPGGAFAIIAQALGLEAGGAIGIPLFIAQAASAALYLYAFSEAWGYLFPGHDPRIVVSVAFVLVGGLALRSTSLAFRAQAVMLGVVVLALLSAFGGLFTVERIHSPQWVARFPEASLIQSFVLFFPAATGIMVGTAMSGVLADPRRSIPVGTLSSWLLTLVVFLLAAVWYSIVADPATLLAQKTIMVDRALVGPLVLFGVMSSTLMAALSSSVAASQLLQAMAEQNVVPLRDVFAARGPDGEPRNALVASLGIGALGLLSGSLDAVAPVITSFFLLTYLGVNLVVLLEQRLAMISFRPTFEVHPTVPVLGVAFCAGALVLTSPFGGVPEFLVVVGIYAVLGIRQLETPWETVRSGIPVTIAAWAARQAAGHERSERAWKPDLLVPVQGPGELTTLQPLLQALTHRAGSVKLVGIGRDADLRGALEQTGQGLRRGGVHSAWSVLDGAESYGTTVRLSMELLRAALFPPNLVVVDGSAHGNEDLQEIVTWCHEQGVGLLLVLPAPDAPWGSNDQPFTHVNVWVSDRSPDWTVRIHLTNLDLQILGAWLLSHAMGVQLRLVSVLKDPERPASDTEGPSEDMRQEAERFLDDVIQMGRLPAGTGAQVLQGDFMEQLGHAGPAQLHLFGMPLTVDLERLEEIRAQTGGTALFVLESGRESALA